MTRIELFMAKVEKTDNCWNWKGYVRSDGYGEFWNGTRIIRAHHYLINPEGIPRGLNGCHTCDNPKCVRPSHIFVGTRSDNMQDMIRKGRHNPAARARQAAKAREKIDLKNGQENQASKLTNEQAVLVKAYPKIHGAASPMAKILKVSIAVVCEIRNGKRWKWLPETTPEDVERAKVFFGRLP